MNETLGGHGLVHEHLVWLAVLLAFAASCVGLALLYRRLSRRVELERAEALLEQEFEHLGAAAAGPPVPDELERGCVGSTATPSNEL